MSTRSADALTWARNAALACALARTAAYIGWSKRPVDGQHHVAAGVDEVDRPGPG